jgi:hypothetical protein
MNVHVPTEERTDDMKDKFYQKLEHVFHKFPKYQIKILLGDLIARVSKEDLFNPTIGNESLHEISNDNAVRLVNFATSKNLRLKSTMFPYRNIHKYTWASPAWKSHNQIDHILVDRRRHSNILDVRLYGAADCDTDYYLVVTKIRERLAVNKQRSHRFQMERFNLKKLREAESKEQYCVDVSNRIAVLEDFKANVEFNSDWEMIRENINISAKEGLDYCELKKHKPWFDEACSKLVDQRKQAKL